LVVGNGNNDVGNNTATRKAGRIGLAGGVSEPRIDKPGPLKVERSKICGAMLQQCADSGNFSAPQKFVRLVGCRDPEPKAWVRPRPAPQKR
jgi:hypothetical protein